MISKKNTRIKVTISKKQKEELKALAEYEGRTISNLVAFLIKEYLKNNNDKLE